MSNTTVNFDSLTGRMKRFWKLAADEFDSRMQNDEPPLAFLKLTAARVIAPFVLPKLPGWKWRRSLKDRLVAEALDSMLGDVMGQIPQNRLANLVVEAELLDQKYVDVLKPNFPNHATAIQKSLDYINQRMRLMAA